MTNEEAVEEFYEFMNAWAIDIIRKTLGLDSLNTEEKEYKNGSIKKSKS